MKLQRKSFTFEFKAAADGSEPGTFEGYGSVFGVLDSQKDIVAAGAFTDSLMATAAAGRTIPVLWQHDTRQPIGVYTSLEQDSTGLKVVGRLAVPDVQQANEALALLKMRAITDMSIGYYTRASSYDEKTGINTLTKLDLAEVSLVTIGANPSAQISDVKSRLERGEILTVREFEEFLREKGYSRSQAEAIASNGYKSFLTRESGDDSANTLIDMIKQVRKF